MSEMQIQDQINRLVLNDEIIRNGGDIKDHVVNRVRPGIIASALINDMALISVREGLPIGPIKIGGLSMEYYEEDFLLNFNFISNAALDDIYESERSKFAKLESIKPPEIIRQCYYATYVWFKYAIIMSFSCLDDNCSSGIIFNDTFTISSKRMWDIVNGYQVYAFHIESGEHLKFIASKPSLTKLNEMPKIISLCTMTDI